MNLPIKKQLTEDVTRRVPGSFQKHSL